MAIIIERKIMEEILKLLELEKTIEVAKENRKTAENEENLANKAFSNKLQHILDSGKVKFDHVYIINEKAVIFRKRFRDEECRHGKHDYSYEILPLVTS